MQEENKGKSNEKSKGLKIGSFLVIMFLLIYIPSLLHWVYDKRVATEIMRMGSLEDMTNTDGFLVRDEEELISPFEGKCITSVNEGEKVPVGLTIATIHNNSSEAYLDQLRDLDLRIIEYYKKQNESREVFSDDMKKIDKEIDEKVKGIIQMVNSNNLGKIESIKGEMNTLVEKKATIGGGLSKSDTFLNSLLDQKQALQEKIKQNKKEVIVETAGIISYTVDGYEKLLNPSNARELVPKDLDSIKAKTVSNNINSIRLEAGKPFAKIIKGIDAYVVVSLNKSKARLFNQDDSIKLRINDIGKVVNGTVSYVSDIEGDYGVVVVKFDKGISETSALRKINVDLIRNSYSGLKVPLTSLKNIDKTHMTAQIMLVRANYATERNVKIVGMDDDYAIITSPDKKVKTDEIKEIDKGIRLYDIFVVNPINIEEGQLIDK